MQVAFIAVLIDALHAALEDAVEAFNRVRVSGATHVFFRDVVDALVLGELLAQLDVELGFIRLERALRLDVLGEDRGAGGRDALGTPSLRPM